MFYAVTVLDWRTQSGVRVPDAAGNLYVLNTNRMFEITEAYDGNLTMFFFDNPSNSKDGGARMKLDSSLAALLASVDSDHGAEAVTLDYFPNNDSSESTDTITLNKKQIAYCYPYGNKQSHALSWVMYSEGGYDMKRILVNHSWIPLIVLLEA